MDANRLADHLIEKAAERSRFMLAVAGPPGAGKSTLAQNLDDIFRVRGERSKIVPMDGFHLDNSILKQRGLLERKGAPETFDVNGFIHLIRRLRNPEDDVFTPTFDRERDIAIAGADCISMDEKFLIAEGNYLLLNSDPWKNLHQYWDENIFVNPGIEVLEKRLVHRWLDHGHDLESAQKRAQANDLPNARLVLKESAPANITIDEQ